jgi:hypothetical protein
MRDAALERLSAIWNLLQNLWGTGPITDRRLAPGTRKPPMYSILENMR